jgi:ribosomal protein S18 acetylase RimI-like enzyme
LDDIEAMVDIHMEGFAGYRSTLLGRRFAATLMRWFIATPEALAILARREGAAVGFVTGAPFGYARQLNRHALPSAIVSLMLRPWLLVHPEVLKGISPKLRQLAARTPVRDTEDSPLSPAPTFSLVGIGVASASRGLGVAAHLMEVFEGDARKKGFERLRLSVRGDNHAAIRAYEKGGWILQEAKTSGYLLVFVKSLRSID